MRKPASEVAAAVPDIAAGAAALASGSEDERWAAVRALPDVPGGARALGEALLREKSPRVREAIFTALARIATRESVEQLLPLVRSDDAALRTGALDALRAMKGVVSPHVPALLHDPDPDVRVLACELVRELPGDEAGRLLCELLATEAERNVCASAVEVLAEVGGPEALPVLAACAVRFRGIAFLEFSIGITTDRIRSQSPPRA